MTENPESLPATDNIASPEMQLEKKRKRRDFWFGLLLSLGVNVVLGILLTVLGVVINYFKLPDWLKTSSNIVLFSIPWLINIGLIIYFLIKHRNHVVLGIVSLYAILLALTIVLGLVVGVVCFILAASSS